MCDFFLNVFYTLYSHFIPIILNKISAYGYLKPQFDKIGNSGKTINNFQFKQ